MKTDWEKFIKEAVAMWLVIMVGLIVMGICVKQLRKHTASKMKGSVSARETCTPLGTDQGGCCLLSNGVVSCSDIVE